MVIPGLRPDWFTWLSPDLDWCKANAELPGLQPDTRRGQFCVHFHVSHFPCMPEKIRVQALQTQPPYWQPAVVGTTPLRPYQATDLEVLRSLRGALLCYQMRLGKTALACHLHEPATGRLVIVAPLAAREAWRDWVDRTFNTGLICLAGRTPSTEDAGYPAYFCHYEILAAHVGFLSAQGIGTLVLDEVHLLQGRGTQRMSAVNLLAPRAQKILGLTGTPMWNKPRSLYQLLHAIMPGAWGSAFGFGTRYCGALPGAHGWTYDGISNATELEQRLAQVMVRRTWAEVLPDLPPSSRVIEPIALTGAQLAQVESAAMRASLAQGTPNEAGYNAILRRKLGEVKIKPAMADARRALADGHPRVVLWCWHNEIADKLAEVLVGDVPVFRLSSSQVPRARELAVQGFRAAPQGILVANMGVGGVGLDLSCADYAIFVEFDWTPAVMDQTAMRTFHMDRPHVLVFLYADCPVESVVVEALDVKNGFAAALGLGEEAVARRILQ